MTAHEFHVNKIIPLRKELSRLEKEWEKINRKEKAEAAGLDIAICDNCAYSSVLMISDHNECLGGYCTCCHDYCYKWMAETPVSAWLREHHKYNDDLVYRLKDMFGDDFLKCDDVDMILQALRLMDEIKTKAQEARK